ncbi:hypothetical protein D1614_25490 [Maribellus luteus]|uniref:Uncharacterized protein n=1 Tax=Maribellus luteus TaxID=2305463 RepID=A0A399SI55_9BACT|nr:hypothetical protein D1614_25490 [Maribellus luteus]
MDGGLRDLNFLVCGLAGRICAAIGAPSASEPLISGRVTASARFPLLWLGACALSPDGGPQM